MYKLLIRVLATIAVFAAAAGSLPGFAVAQEGMRAVGSLSYVPEPAREQRGIFNLRSSDENVRAVRIEAVSGSADIVEIRFVFRSGVVERVRMGEKLRPGGLTGTVRTNTSRPLQRVEVSFVPTGSVTLVLRADTRAPAPSPPPPAPPPAQWRELGCKNVGFLIDRDIVNVTTNDTFRALRLRSSGFEIEMIEMAVVFVNGQRDIYRLNTRIPSGSYTSPIDLRGEKRRIRQVELVYRTRILSNQKTQLCVDGLRAN